MKQRKKSHFPTYFSSNFAVQTVDEKNEPVAFNQFGTFVTKAGNFGGPKSSPEARLTADPPSRPPDATMSEKTSVDQV